MSPLSPVPGQLAALCARLEVVPPLNPGTAWIRVLTAGHSAQARTVLPLR